MNNVEQGALLAEAIVLGVGLTLYTRPNSATAMDDDERRNTHVAIVEKTLPKTLHAHQQIDSQFTRINDDVRAEIKSHLNECLEKATGNCSDSVKNLLVDPQGHALYQTASVPNLIDEDLKCIRDNRDELEACSTDALQNMRTAMFQE